MEQLLNQSEGQLTLDTEDWVAGTYLIKITTATGKPYHLKLVITNKKTMKAMLSATTFLLGVLLPLLVEAQ